MPVKNKRLERIKAIRKRLLRERNKFVFVQTKKVRGKTSKKYNRCL